MSINTAALTHCEVIDENNRRVPLYKLWEEQTSIFVFLRHFACIACRAHAKEVWKNRERYEKAGAKIHFIGNGSPHFIEGFKEDLGLQEASVFTDPERQAFRAAEFKKGFFSCLGPLAVANGLKLIKNGHKQVKYTKGMGDLWQLGGVLVVKPESRIALHYISEQLGDFPTDKDIEESI